MTQRIPRRVTVALLFLVALLLAVAVVLYTHVPLGHVGHLLSYGPGIMSRRP